MFFSSLERLRNSQKAEASKNKLEMPTIKTELRYSSKQYIVVMVAAIVSSPAAIHDFDVFFMMYPLTILGMRRHRR